MTDGPRFGRGVDPFHTWEFLDDTPTSEADYASRRLLGRTTVGRSFPLKFGRNSDVGHPARTVWQVISNDDGLQLEYEGECEVVDLHSSGAGRVQVKARIVKERGRVSQIRFERIEVLKGREPELKSILNFDEEASRRLIEMCLTIRGIDPAGDQTLKFDDDFLAALLEDPRSLTAVYERDPNRFREVIENDVNSEDVVALASKRRALEEFRQMLSPADGAVHSEGEWQAFFERNSWILGVGLSSHLFTSWDAKKLERHVAGSSVAAVGKRVDALLTTSGAIRALVLAEIKLPSHDLVDQKYRSGTYSISSELAGGVAQAHVTAERAREDIGTLLKGKDADGFLTGEETRLVQPRSYLVIGRLESLTRGGNVHEDMFRSFEMFRRNIHSPEILTYDEVFARAEWALAAASDGIYDD